MLKSLRVPERLFQLTMWVVSLVFASFLIGLGGKIVGDLPGVDQRIAIEQFMDPARVARGARVRDSLRRAQEDRTSARERSALTLTAASNGYRAARESFENWIATRTATTNPQQDPEVIRRTRELDELKSGERTAQRDVEQLDAELLRIQQANEEENRVESEMTEAAQSQFDRAVFTQELQVFGIRLLLTLPLLVLAAWFVVRKRKSQYWPLARGFVVFALFAFFVELVPYLPSYGGYVRYGVGVIVSLLVGVYAIRAMRQYVARRAAEEQRTESERRQALGYEEALKRMSANVCPSCERPIAAISPGAVNSPSNFCVHCGLTLYDNCTACSARKNAFFHYCPSCGVPAAGPDTTLNVVVAPVTM